MGWETERTNAQEGDVSQMKLRAGLGWAGWHSRATRCSPKHRHCRAQQAAGHEHQMGCEAATEKSTEFLIMF